MVLVRVEWLEGCSPEQKRMLVAQITESLERVAGARRANVHVVLHDVPPGNWGPGGRLPERQGEDRSRESGAAGDRRVVAAVAGAALSGPAGSSQVFDLEQPRTSDMPVFPAHRPGFNYFLHRHHEDDYQQNRPRTSASGVIVCTEHSGTHIDAICHQADDLSLYGGVLVGDAQTSRGFSRLGAEEIPPILAPGVLLDVAAYKGMEELEAHYAVTAEDLDACCAGQGVSVGAGDVVLVRTGNGRRWRDPERYLDGPGMAANASRWLAERGVLAVGADNMAWDLVGIEDPELGVMLPGHLILLARGGIYIIENLRLEELAAIGHHRFTFVCAAPKFAGATGAPVRPLAIVAGEVS